MNKLVKSIKDLAEVVNVEEAYDWEVPANCPIDIPDHLPTSYEKNRHLKSALEPELDSDSDFSAHYWVIKEWGGIKSFKVNESNNQKIRTFRKELEKGRLTRPTFSVISSLSKLASFWNHEQYAIYDSRAVFALNWLLIRHTSERILFPQPPGRNKELADLDLEALLRLAKTPFDLHDKKTAFHNYCHLLRELSREALGEHTPFKLEMLLFVAAPDVIAKDVRDRVKLKIDLNEDNRTRMLER
jgi:hypothetical protein